MLCHISENKAVVKVTGWINDKKVGSSLAEGSTVEIAEDKAISRLKNRLNIKNNNQINTKIKGDSKLKQQINVEVTKKEKVENINKNEEPSDWSNELTSIDSEIERLKWSRNEEIKFLEENLGINNRNKITKYKDLIYYLSLLKKINNSDSSNNNKLNIETLIKESDIILKELSWDNEQGRDYLQKEFNVSKRIDLDINQMISFLGKLKSIRNQSFTN